MPVYPVTSDATRSAALTAIGSQRIGQSEVPLLKQILVAIASGSPVPPAELDGAYLTPNSLFYYVTPNGAFYYQQPA